jgi:hypothetical protein
VAQQSKPQAIVTPSSSTIREPSMSNTSEDQYRWSLEFLAKELFLAQQRLAHAQAEVKVSIWFVRKSLTESLELLRKIDAVIAGTRAERCDASG